MNYKKSHYKLRVYEKGNGKFALFAYRFGRPRSVFRAQSFYVGTGDLDEIEEMKRECEKLCFSQLGLVKNRHSKRGGNVDGY
jgi:hypothetical protein